MARSTWTAAAGVVMALAAGGCASTSYRYLRTFEPIPAGKTSDLSEAEQKAEAALQEIARAPVSVEYLGKMFKSAVVVVMDHQDLTFTARLKDGAWTVTRGTEPGLKPDYVVPLVSQNLANTAAIVADGKIDDEEAYRIHRATFVPALRSFFRVDGLYEEALAERLALPPLIHFTLKNPKGYLFLGSPREVSATAANVNGQWLIFEGLLGDPDRKIEVTREQAADFSALLYSTPAAGAANLQGVLESVDKVKAFLDSVTVARKR